MFPDVKLLQIFSICCSKFSVVCLCLHFVWHFSTYNIFTILDFAAFTKSKLTSKYSFFFGNFSSHNKLSNLVFCLLVIIISFYILFIPFYYLIPIDHREKAAHTYLDSIGVYCSLSTAVYYRINLGKIDWFGKFWFACPKYHLWGIFPILFLSKNTKVFFEIECPRICLIAKSDSQESLYFNIFYFWYEISIFEKKPEWEKRPISDI